MRGVGHQTLNVYVTNEIIVEEAARFCRKDKYS